MGISEGIGFEVKDPEEAGRIVEAIEHIGAALNRADVTHPNGMVAMLSIMYAVAQQSSREHETAGLLRFVADALDAHGLARRKTASDAVN